MSNIKLAMNVHEIRFSATEMSQMPNQIKSHKSDQNKFPRIAKSNHFCWNC